MPDVERHPVWIERDDRQYVYLSGTAVYAKRFVEVRFIMFRLSKNPL